MSIILSQGNEKRNSAADILSVSCSTGNYYHVILIQNCLQEHLHHLYCWIANLHIVCLLPVTGSHVCGKKCTLPLFQVESCPDTCKDVQCYVL